LETATLIDLDILTFWELTPYEFSLMVKSYTKKIKQQQEDSLVLTYLGAAWQRAKKMPSLDRILGKQQQPKQMTPEEMLQKVLRLNKAFGGTKEGGGIDDN
jgi:predicted RNase H-like nuclease